MGTSPQDAIHFGCRRCQARLWAAPCQAGRRLRCPFCQLVATVPTAEEATARAGKPGPDAEYALHEGSEPPGPQPPYIAVTCPVCATRMVARPDQVGQTLVCPDCDTAVEVRAPVEPPAPKRPIRPADPGDEYPLWGVGQPPPEVTAVYQTYIPVVCSVCRTRMLATEAEVGQTLTCPDCGTAAAVPPLAPPPARQHVPTPAGDEDATYAVRASSGRPGAEAAAYQTHFPVLCPLCGTRLHAAPEQVGEQLICPDCRTPIPVRAPAAAPPAIDPMAGAEAAYAIGAPVRPPPWKPIFTSIWDQEGEEGREEETEDEQQTDEGQPTRRLARRRPARAPAPVPGRWWRGIAGFLLEQGVWPRWLMLTGGMMVVLFLSGAALVVAISLGIDVGLGGLGFALLALSLSGLAAIAAVLWLAVFGAWAVVIVVDTAAGADAIENWPDGPYQDWLPDAFYLVNATAFAAAPGMLLRWLPAHSPVPDGPFVAASLFLMFPIVFLSMLERGSAIWPLSGAILASLLWRWWAWLLFYVAAAVLLTFAVGLAALALLALGGWGSVPAVCILAGAALLYFRLLGRLGMVCAGVEEHRPAEPRRAVP